MVIEIYAGCCWSKGWKMVQFTLQELRILHAFHTDTLAYRANVPEEIVINMLNNQPIPQEHARKVLLALSKQYGRYYTQANVFVQVSAEGQE